MDNDEQNFANSVFDSSSDYQSALELYEANVLKAADALLTFAKAERVGFGNNRVRILIDRVRN